MDPITRLPDEGDIDSDSASRPADSPGDPATPDIPAEPEKAN